MHSTVRRLLSYTSAGSPDPMSVPSPSTVMAFSQVCPPSVLRRVTTSMLLGRSPPLVQRLSAAAITVPSAVVHSAGMR